MSNIVSYNYSSDYRTAQDSNKHLKAIYQKDNNKVHASIQSKNLILSNITSKDLPSMEKVIKLIDMRSNSTNESTDLNKYINQWKQGVINSAFVVKDKSKNILGLILPKNTSSSIPSVYTLPSKVEYKKEAEDAVKYFNKMMQPNELSFRNMWEALNV